MLRSIQNTYSNRLVCGTVLLCVVFNCCYCYMIFENPSDIQSISVSKRIVVQMFSSKNSMICPGRTFQWVLSPVLVFFFRIRFTFLLSFLTDFAPNQWKCQHIEFLSLMLRMACTIRILRDSRKEIPNEMNQTTTKTRRKIEKGEESEPISINKNHRCTSRITFQNKQIRLVFCCNAFWINIFKSLWSLVCCCHRSIN